MLVPSMAPWRDDWFRAGFEDRVHEPVGIVSSVRHDIMGVEALDQIAACFMSFSCPGPARRRTGRPNPSVTACSLVEYPPFERPSPWDAAPPFLAAPPPRAYGL